MKQTQMWEKMRRLLRYMFRQHEGGEFVPDARERLKEELVKEEVNPDTIEAFEKAIYSDAHQGVEGDVPLSDTEKYLIAHLMIYKLFGGEDLREKDFLREADAAHLRPEDILAILDDVWPSAPSSQA